MEAGPSAPRKAACDDILNHSLFCSLIP